MRSLLTLFVVLLGSVFDPSASHADGECTGGYHDMTPEELATMTTVLESARAAVPDPPVGWINTLNDDSVSPPHSVCLDVFPWAYSYSRAYSRVEGAEEREQAIAAAGADYQAAMAQKQPRLDALMAQINIVSAEFAEAATSGDNARVEAANAEMERLSAEYETLMSEDDPAAAFQAATVSHYADLEMGIAVTVNPYSESPMEGAQPIEVNGASSAWQWASGDDGQQGNVLVLLGNWGPAASGYGLEAARNRQVSPEQPQAISVRIHAHKDRVPSMIEATNFQAMAALLEH